MIKRKKVKLQNKKIRVSSLIALITSILFALINGWIGIYYKSILSLSFFIFYIVLAIITTIIFIRFYKKAHIDTVKLYFWSHIVLIVLDTLLIIPLILILEHQDSIDLPLWVFILYAVYTAYKIADGIIGYRINKHNNVLLFTELKTMKIIDASLSALSLANIGLFTFIKGQLSFNTKLSFLIVGSIFILCVIAFTSISFYRGLKLIRYDKHYKQNEQ